MNQKNKSRLLRLISNSQIQNAIDSLLSLDIPENKRQEAVSISSQYQELQTKVRRGILSIEQEDLQRNQIVNRLINCINVEGKPTSIDKNLLNTTKRNRIVQIIGLIGGIALILGLWWMLWGISTNTSLQLTVFVKDKDGNVAIENNGELHTTIGHQTFHAIIGENGRTTFDEIPIHHKGQSITIGLEAEGWEIENRNNEYVFTGEPITLQVKRDNSLGIIKGMVKSRDGQNFIKGALIQINTDTSVSTNELGIFKIVLPHKMQVNKLTDNYLLTISKEGYKTKTQYHSPKSSDAEIRLEKK